VGDETDDMELTFSFGFLTVSLGSAPISRSLRTFNNVSILVVISLCFLFEIGFKLRYASFLRCHELRHQSFKIVGTTIVVRRIVVESTVRGWTVWLVAIRRIGRIGLILFPPKVWVIFPREIVGITVRVWLGFESVPLISRFVGTRGCVVRKSYSGEFHTITSVMGTTT
jgi:hypothetical protein